ncbi:MAG: pyruvate ferredoxin oxidoreductase [Candidatus Omnitrophica bacterium]|nr:pyruvate ferredoxin oxidoreductase [Candidatus Omnitrophota bacterium]MBU1047571.1 pyruvate ferredoxin oxidoreductase [Candidatus Omnitrophota bacterium]MBU1630485.1 pyruvate ferredoxin oxidoreductase [Candidatus Omnitrophota bacterium]MBU1766998.1 pyruvate ferredoxin oxidoreductase [Candidatus Omnitrophota bacterium]MBU1888934.1 pyruvate ferredoxin oxidoreductase [Candidatus Omnitrophota bacterium]
MPSLKELSKEKESLSGGHRLCAGCGASIVARQVLLTAPKPLVVTCATGCLEVATTIFPYTAWEMPWMHSAFENAAATCSGIESAYQSLKKQGTLPVDANINFITFGGDGGTYDIGLQSLSGAMERGHKMLYVCYNNQAYMNTGIQRSSATPKGGFTTTSPVGKVKPGKEQSRKDLTEIMVAHNIPYVAQAVVGDWRDLTTKVQKALSKDGPSFINVLTPCRLGWGCAPEKTLDIGRLAADTCFWPLYEVEEGVYKLTHKPKEKKPIIKLLKLQDRFKHLFKKGNEALLAEIQEDIDKKWKKLLFLCGEKSE